MLYILNGTKDEQNQIQETQNPDLTQEDFERLSSSPSSCVRECLRVSL